jgi:AcrR family transcriptional regulator
MSTVDPRSSPTGTLARPVAHTPIRDQKTAATRARIADVALELFIRQGFADTSIDQIADEAGVGRRTVFRHFPTKQAILVDHLVVRRELAVERLRARPADEPALVSLHAVLRQLTQEGYDRRLLAQIRAVLASEPGPLGEDIARQAQSFERAIVVVLAERTGASSKLEVRALTLMALSWVDAAVRTYLLDNEPSLVDCFDDVVAACLDAGAADLRAHLIGERTPGRRTAGGSRPHQA